MEEKQNKCDMLRPGFRVGQENRSLTKEIALFRTCCFLLEYFLMKIM